MPVLKVEGAGNDFLLGTGEWAERLEQDPGLSVRLCDRHRGVGGDGTIALFAQAPGRVRMVYRNADGSRARFCANATRCASRVATEVVGSGSDIVVETDRGDIGARIRGDVVSLELEPPEGPPRSLTLEAAGQSWSGRALDFGVPHLVIECDDVEAVDLALIGPLLRSHPALEPSGANVNLVAVEPDGRLRIRTYERGVEAETLCCGSGVAVSALLRMADSGDRQVSCQVRSGDELTVEALGMPPGCRIRQSGPTRIVAEVIPRGSWLSD